MLTQAQLERARAALIRWRGDPVLFCREVLGFEPWHTDGLGCDSQRDIMRSVAQSSRITIRSGHKCGKSWMCAAIALHEFTCYPGSRTVISAPTYRQIDEIIWRAIREMHRNALIPIGGVLAVTPGKGLRHPKHDTQVFGFSTNEADRFSGISGERVTYILDEASGISPAIFQAIAGNRMSGARLILISNPTQPVGEFYDSFHVKAGLYKRHHISSVRLAQAIERGAISRIKGLADASAVKEFIQEYGENSDEFRVRAEGEFASQGALSIISAVDYDAAMNRWEPMTWEWSRHRLEVAVDVARFGDDSSVIIGRRGRHVLPPQSHHNVDGPTLGMRIANYIQANRTPVDGTDASMKPRVRIENVGVGTSCYDYLSHNFGRLFDVVSFDPSSSANESSKYVNARAEAWFNARRVLATGPWQLPAHARMRTEALSVHYKYDEKNRYQVEKKDDIKKRLNGQSPDFADALVILLWEPSDGFMRLVRIPGV